MFLEADCAFNNIQVTLLNIIPLRRSDYKMSKVAMLNKLNLLRYMKDGTKNPQKIIFVVF